MTGIGLRAATIEDALALAELQDEANAGHLRARVWSRPGTDWREVGAEEIADEASEMSWRRTVVALLDSEIVGMLNYADNETVPNVTDVVGAPFVSLRRKIGPGVYLRAMAVRPRCRGHGVGSSLLDVAADAARRSGAEAIGVIVHETNERLAAHYRARGFREVARERVLRHHVYPVGSDLVALRLGLKGE